MWRASVLGLKRSTGLLGLLAATLLVAHGMGR